MSCSTAGDGSAFTLDLALVGWRPLKNPERSRNPLGFLMVLVGACVGVVEPLGGGESALTADCSLTIVESGTSSVAASEGVVGGMTGDCSAEIVLEATLNGR